MLQQTKTTKHDRYVQELCKKVKDRYDYLILDYNISNKKRMLGQVDLCGIKNNRMDLYEVKCSFRVHKAAKQLRRAQRITRTNGELFFYCGSSGQLEPIACENR